MCRTKHFDAFAHSSCRSIVITPVESLVLTKQNEYPPWLFSEGASLQPETVVISRASTNRDKARINHTIVVYRFSPEHGAFVEIAKVLLANYHALCWCRQRGFLRSLFRHSFVSCISLRFLLFRLV